METKESFAEKLMRKQGWTDGAWHASYCCADGQGTQTMAASYGPGSSVFQYAEYLSGWLEYTVRAEPGGDRRIYPPLNFWF